MHTQNLLSHTTHKIITYHISSTSPPTYLNHNTPYDHRPININDRSRQEGWHNNARPNEPHNLGSDGLPPGVSGTIIRGTSNTPKHGQKTSSGQTVKADKHGSSQGLIYQGTRSRLARARPRARTVARDGFTPRPRAPSGKLCRIATLAISPYHRPCHMRI
jgi:hypothetical protein